jgi:DNA-directed RNA polymerase specialized sigma24 family protein
MGTPDEELVRACARGDAEAWRTFVALYSGWVQRIARAALKGAEADAEDACSEVFRQLVDRDRAMLRALKPPYHLRAWLAIITRRACGKILRRRPAAAGAPEKAAPPASSIDDHLAALPPADRLLLELFFVHDCSYEEIAGILGISVESVGKQKTRALEKLRKEIP